MALQDTHTRVTIQVPRHTVDVTITKDQPIALLVGDVVDFVRDALVDDEESTDWLSDMGAVWQLATPLGVHYVGAETPSQAEIVDGQVLVLVKSQQRENYPPLIDDVAESIAYYQRQHFGQWTSDGARGLAAVVAPIATFVVIGSFVQAVHAGLVDVAGQVLLAGLFGLAAVAAIALASAWLRSGEDSKKLSGSTKRLAGSVIGVGYLFAAAAGLLMIPGDITIFSVVLASVVVMTAALVVLLGGGYPEKLNYATVSAGLLFTVAALLNLMTGLDPLVFSVYLAAVALAFLLMSSRLALVLAKIPMPFVPTIGETFLHDDADDITTVETGSGTAAITAIINQEKQVITAYHCIVGLIWGGLAAIITSAVIAATSLTHHQNAVFVFYIVVPIAMLFRGKSFEDAVVQRSWLAAAVTTFALFVGGTALTGRNLQFVVIGSVLLLLGVAVATLFAVHEKVINSPVMMKMLELFERLCFAAPVVLIVIIIDGFQKARGR